MALKTKNPPPLTESAPAAAKTFNLERMMKVDPAIDHRLNNFIQNNSKLNDYYTELVTQHPQRAVRSFMLNKMFRHEAQLRVAERQAPQAKEWLEQQDPGLKQRIMERLQKINPFYREKALVREIAREKTQVDFAPKHSTGPGVSI